MQGCKMKAKKGYKFGSLCLSFSLYDFLLFLLYGFLHKELCPLGLLLGYLQQR